LELPRVTLGEPRATDDPWRGVQPRYEKIVMRGPHHFELVAKLPSGEPINVRLAPLPKRVK
jgi:hypothetical protein